VEAQVKVESAAVAQATGAAPQTQLGEVETAVVQALAGFFGILLVEGLVLAGSVRRFARPRGGAGRRHAFAGAGAGERV
jgi:hypothetical protein